jgi:metal-responsive CopG/Arc/MetJ family transcriptional regulator
MPAKGKVRITVDEELEIVEKLDELARAEGLSRNDIVRRAIRLFLMPKSSISGYYPSMVQITDIPA